jgi:ferredoxin, 2Fe-2S
MVKITYIEPRGSRREVDLDSGLTLMQGAINSNVAGIVAECGGACVCATCHVYVDERYLAVLPPPTATEHEMLGAVMNERRPNSRLSCQIKVSSQLDGAVIRVAERQI